MTINFELRKKVGFIKKVFTSRKSFVTFDVEFKYFG